MREMIGGDITLAGVTLTLEEWQSLDQESQELLLSLAVDAPDRPFEREPGERTVQIPAMLDLLSRSARS